MIDLLNLETLSSIAKVSLNVFWQIFRVWWWVPLPIILLPPLKFMYLWYIQEKWNDKIKKIILEVKVPEEVPRLIQSMEQTFAGFHGTHDVFTWKQKWIQGQYQLSSSFEIVSIEGEIHFFIRTQEPFRKTIESNIYAQYPQAEIFQVEDYTQNVPQDVPNKDWDIFGWDMINSVESPYPIRTYKDFEEMPLTPEEKRIDPLAGLLEGMAMLGPGEQLWVQFRATPTRVEIPWALQGKKIVSVLVKRPPPKKPRSIVGEVVRTITTGQPPFSEEEKKPEIIPPEMRMTPGERDIVKGIEDKISKVGYYTNIRCIYLGKRDVYFKPKIQIAFGFFKQVSTENLNGLKPFKKTFPRVEWFWPKRRIYLRKRRAFKHYVMRVETLYPRDPPYPSFGGRFILNIEELATLFHFPGRLAAPSPGLPRIAAKKGGPPPVIPSQ